MSHGYDLSICVVNWNGGEMLRRLLTSLHDSADELALEVIVVDNGSVDGSADMIAETFPGVHLVRNATNVGFARGNNQAARVARGRYLFFLNNDTLVPPRAMGKLVQFLDANPAISAVGPRLIGVDGRPQRSFCDFPTVRALLHRILLLRWTRLFRSAYRRYRRTGFNPQRSQPAEVLTGAALAVRRAPFFACGMWDEAFLFGVEDIDLCKRLAPFGPLLYLAEVEIVHFGRVSSRANRAFAYGGSECGYAYFLTKHDRRPWVPLLYKLLVTLDLPVRLLLQGVQWALKRSLARTRAARLHYEQLAATATFLLRDLGRFWRT